MSLPDMSSVAATATDAALERRPRLPPPRREPKKRRARLRHEPRVEDVGRLPDNPQRLISSEHVRVAGGIDEYATKLRDWWNHPRHDADVQREARTGILLAIVKTLCNGRDSDWAAAVPQGLTQAAGRASGKQQARAMVRGDEVSRERLRLLQRSRQRVA